MTLLYEDMEAKYEWNKRDKNAAHNIVLSDTCHESLFSKPYQFPDEMILQRMADPPMCFCSMPAHQSETDLGTMYDCSRLRDDTIPDSKRNSDATRICGFHVHKRPWNNFRDQLLQGKNLDLHDPELRVCPYFNYTFCVVFGVANDYPKSFPLPPNCFCKITSTMTVEEDDSGDPFYNNRKITFKCSHFNIEGAKPKCVFSLSAAEVAFFRPNRILHSADLPKMQAFLNNVDKYK